MGGSLITPTDAYQEEVQELFTSDMFYQEDTAELLEIENVSKYNSRPKCRQKMEYSDTQMTLQCVCGDTMKEKILTLNRVKLFV